eukprot:CAMPEP_0168542732 /NCGR_PEP_ID=MMETSP0413-20121227/1501_1 /TAXON_ID=136452 /ORGANISM="Filamoeba nolandi, Strain NC-AS-23-1" /LENGTH=397 /DNA_ID=CAMNT_0008572621 /DNA_START=1225 /DNA_END=2415 /DNA_ORIENTATION=-
MKGYSERLDKVRELRDDKQRLISELQTKYRNQTGISSLKINRNNIIGYFIEISPSHRAKIPAAFQLYQTNPSSIRYKSPELAELEQKMVSATFEAIEIEKQIFEELVGFVCGFGDQITHSAQALAFVDLSSSLALLAIQRNYVRPTIDNSLHFEVTGGRHPTVEAIQGDKGESFVSNDCSLSSEKYFWLVTGPNMGGKSTFLRQTAIIGIMAQMGCYVPAEFARIGVIDAIFSRVGAHDDLAHDRSTFMVEMVETAYILRNATKHSLVIMDEVGRGTSTYDGLSIAWSCIEYLYKVVRCRCLFATHYHELTQLEKTFPGLSCKTLAVKEVNGNVIFLHKIVGGVSDRSFGIHVADLAGMVPSVTKRARELLQELLQNSKHGSLILKQSNQVDKITEM